MGGSVRRPAVQLAQVQNQRAVRILDIAPGAGLVVALRSFDQRSVPYFCTADTCGAIRFR